MAEENPPPERAYELFGEVKTTRDGLYSSEETPGYDFETMTEGQEKARQSVPIVRKTDAERREDQQDLEASTPGILEGANIASQQEWIPRLIASQQSFTPNPDYEWTEEKLRSYTEGLPEDAIDYIAQAQSDEEAEYLAKRYREDAQREQELAKLGWTGVGLRVGAAMTDPAAWGIGVAASALTGPGGLLATAASRTSRAARIISGGVAGATGNVAVEAAIGANKPVWDEMNLLYAAGIGFGLGGGLSAISRNPSTQAEADGLAMAGRGLKRSVEEEIRNITSLKPIEDDAGAMRLSREVPLKDGDDPIDNFYENLKIDPNIAPTAAMAKGRQIGSYKTSSMSMGLTSENPAVRALFKPLAEEGVGYTDRSAKVAFSASERQKLRERAVTTQWMRGYTPNFRAWLKDQDGTGSWKPFYSDEMSLAFNRQVTDYVEGFLEDAHPAVAKQGEVMRKILDDYRKDLNQPMGYREEFGKPVKNFGTKEYEPTYVPHVFDLTNMRKLVSEFGSFNIEQLISTAIKRELGEEITEAAANRAGQAYLKTIRAMDAGMGSDAVRALGSGDVEEIKQFLKDNVNRKAMSETDIEDVVDALTARSKDKDGGPSRGRRRTPLAMDTKLPLRRNPENFPKGGSREVSIRELFNRDSHELLSRYNRQMSGALAMARYRIPGLSDGISSRGEWETLKDRAREIGYREGVDPEVTNRELNEADLMYRAIMGIPNEADLTPFAQGQKFFRDWSFMRFMGQVGFAQVPEAGVAISGVGMKAMFKGMPAYRGLVRDMQTGKIDHEVVDELEVITGLGSDWLNSGQIDRFNEMTGTQDTFLGQSTWKDRLEMSVRKGKRFVFGGSGMSTVNTLLKRSTANGIANKFALAAIGKGKLINKNRLRSIGLDDRQVDLILDNMRKHAEFDKGMVGQKLKRLNINKWDLAAEADFTEAVYRYTNRLVQENDIGQFRQWMTHPIARTFLQFRSFIIGAHEKQLLHNLHMRDFQSFTTFTSTTLLATLGYSSMTYMRSIGRSDQEEYLQKRLSPSELAKASFERSSWAALLPTAIDTAMPNTFTYRSSGQATGAIFGNPTADTIDSANTALRTVLSGNTFDSQEDVQNVLRLLPFQNMNGVAQMSNIILGESGLPEDAPRDR